MEAGVWDKMVACRCNTAIVPVYWELLEPQAGRFDFSLVDGLLEAARRRGLRLVLLWFGTWKNAMSTYVPAWVKTDTKRYFRAQAQPGVKSAYAFPFCNAAISAFCPAAARADARAFAALLRHLKKTDSNERTVIMVQVENETGLLGSERDCCPQANAAFASPVPASLLKHLSANRPRLMPSLKAAWMSTGYRRTGTWEQVFGPAANEAFMAWHVASFVNAVTEAGKREYALPMYANAWLVQRPTQRPGEYPGGGPVARVMDIWHAAAPSIEALAPDIYLPAFDTVCAEYARGGNPLIIPEAQKPKAEANVFTAIAKHNALCFAPFGIDSIANPVPLAESYGLITAMMPLITTHQGRGTMAAIVQDGPGPLNLELGGCRLFITFNRRDPGTASPARGLVIALSDADYLVAGAGFTIFWKPKPGDARKVEFLSVDEGTCEAGLWRAARRLNGDEAWGDFQCFDDTLRTRRVVLHRCR